MGLVDIENLRVTFDTAAGTFPAVSGVDLSIERSEIVGLVGESGCGKTVTALSMLALLSENGRATGKIRLEGENLLEKSKDEMRRIRGNRISMIFQEPMTALNPVMTIGRQLCEPLMRHGGVSGRKARARAERALDMVRVPRPAERMNNYPHQLSGGLCQRVMIAMALICDPILLVADEPTTALDVTIQAQILSLLTDLRERIETAILLITHDLGVVAELCDRVYVMYAGYVVEQADVFALFENPQHPYTSGLLASLPRLDGDGQILHCIPGMVPNLLEMPPGCPFEPRCSEAMEICKRSIPPLVATSDRHAVRCWRRQGDGSDE